MNWQPIETAPRDGAWVLLSGGESSFTLYEYGGREPPSVVGFWHDYGPDTSDWVIAYWDSDWRSVYKTPTHWMPLPEQPK